ncbi:MAG: hypothetical protein GY928_18465 [Colwellia sp.]|nr:hypothetical protein [Colwellia sp.]
MTTAAVQNNLTREQLLLLVEELSTETVREMVLQYVQAETADNDPVSNAIYYYCLNINDVLGEDVISHILSFVRTVRYIGVCVFWDQVSNINEQRNLKEKCRQFLPKNTIAVIVDWQLQVLKDFERKMTMQGPVSSIGQALALQTEECKMVIFIKDGVYKVNMEQDICNVSLISLSTRVTLTCTDGQRNSVYNARQRNSVYHARQRNSVNYGLLVQGNSVLHKIHFVSSSVALDIFERKYNLIVADNYSTLVVQKCKFSSRCHGISILAGAKVHISQSQFIQNSATISIKVSGLQGQVCIEDNFFGGNYMGIDDRPSYAVVMIIAKEFRQCPTEDHSRQNYLCVAQSGVVTKMTIKNNTFCGLQWRNAPLAQTFIYSHYYEAQHITGNSLQSADTSVLKSNSISNRFLFCVIP